MNFLEAVTHLKNNPNDMVSIKYSDTVLINHSGVLKTKPNENSNITHTIDFNYTIDDMFNDLYEVIPNTMDFSEALKLLNSGKKIRRLIWNVYIQVEYNDINSYYLNNGNMAARYFYLNKYDFSAKDWVEVK